jgi:hypothetical protein
MTIPENDSLDYWGNTVPCDVTATDRGACEFHENPRDDFDSDCDVDFIDFAVFADYWFEGIE